MNPFTGKPFGQKEQRVGATEPFTLLGRRYDINPPGIRSFDVAKRKRYADSGNALVRAARDAFEGHSHPTTPIAQKSTCRGNLPVRSTGTYRYVPCDPIPLVPSCVLKHMDM
jgi:hypothetical protein